MSAAVGDFSLSSSDTTELEEAVLSLSESKVSLSDTGLSGLLYWHRLCWQPFLHVQKPVVLPFIPTLWSLRTATYYSGNYARIIAAFLTRASFVPKFLCIFGCIQTVHTEYRTAENLHEFHSFVAIRKSFLCKIWGVAP